MFHSRKHIILLMWGSAILLIYWTLRDLVNWKFLNHVQACFWLVTSWNKKGSIKQSVTRPQHTCIFSVSLSHYSTSRFSDSHTWEIFLLILLYRWKAAKSTCHCTVLSLPCKHSQCSISRTKLSYTSTWCMWPCKLGWKLLEFVHYQ
jgi:hypothetical protein